MNSTGMANRQDAVEIMAAFDARFIGEAAARKTLYESGAPADGLYFLEEGLVELHSSRRERGGIVYELIGPGDVFGEESLTRDGLYSSFATTLTPCALWHIPSSAVSQAAAEHVGAYQWVADMLLRRQARLRRRFRSMCMQDVESRIVEAVIEMAPWFPGTDGLECAIPLSQATLARIVGSTRETVSTLLNRMAGNELLVLDLCRIGVPSLTQLARILITADGE